jgi:hypothetical protein
VVVLGAFIALKGKNYYVSPIYPMIFAAGSIAIEQATEKAGRQWTRLAYDALVAVSGLLLLPLTVPILSPEMLLRFEDRTGLKPLIVFENQNNGLLPQYFADEFGWEDMVRKVSLAYHSLSLADQKKTAIFSNSWGDAAAIDYFGPTYGLPKAICKQDSYWDWGPRDYTGEVMIILCSDSAGERPHFATVQKVGQTDNPYSRRDEWYDIFLCRGLKFDLKKAWPTMRTFD